MPSDYQKFVALHMGGKKFASKKDANAMMKKVGAEWRQVKGGATAPKKARKRKGGSLFGDVVGGAFGVGGDLSRKYL
jgi:hypothetical protein